MAYVDLPTVTIQICQKQGKKSYVDGMDYGYQNKHWVVTQMGLLHVQRNLPKMTSTIESVCA